MRLSIQTLVCACALGAAASALAGTVAVSFIDPASYTDAGNSRWDEDANLKALASHLQALGRRRLPAEQSLKVEVLDVDLAGTMRPSRRGGTDRRVVRGKTDWPRIKLRYQLASNGQLIRKGEELVADMDFTHGVDPVHRTEPLYYERHMLDQWFSARFVANSAPAH